MSKKLAIKGHSTRGKEVIELLEMMGGCSPVETYGLYENRCYLINDKGWIVWDYIGHEEIDKYEIFTLEEFLEKYPFKLGDKVMDDYVFGDPLTIKSMSWSEELKTMLYVFEESDVVLAAKDLESVNDTGFKLEKNINMNIEFDLTKYSYEVMDGKLVISENKNNENKMKNVLAELLEHIKTTPKEELEREFEEIKEWSNVGPTVEEFMTFCESVNKKPFYPKTYDECCKVLDFCGDYFLTTYDEDCIINTKEVYDILQQTNSLIRLLICKSAYWKIAGEEMGLGKPWEPDWTNEEQNKYCISYGDNNIQKVAWRIYNSILSFPTEEMRDAFYENFRDLIESCKELL